MGVNSSLPSSEGFHKAYEAQEATKQNANGTVDFRPKEPVRTIRDLAEVVCKNMGKDDPATIEKYRANIISGINDTLKAGGDLVILWKVLEKLGCRHVRMEKSALFFDGEGKPISEEKIRELLRYELEATGSETDLREQKEAETLANFKDERMALRASIEAAQNNPANNTQNQQNITA